MDQSLWFLLAIVFPRCALLLSPGIAACPYSVEACTCTGNTLLCTNLDGLPSLVSNNQDGSITSLTFQYGKLNNIQANSLPANIQTLVFSNVSITSISPDAFSGSSTTLNAVSMSDVTYSELPEALLNVSSLTELNISDVTITNWRPEVLQYLGKTLRSVAFVNVGLTSWPEWLQNLNLVNSVDLSSNSVHNISPDAFRNFPHLARLILQSTSLSDEKNLNDALTPIQNTLEYLDISSNKFQRIPSSLVNMPNISTFTARFNEIAEITSNRIPVQLKVLDLSANNIGRLTDTSFPQSSSLETLYLALYSLYEISDLAFQPLHHLTGLSLARSYLKTVPLALTKLPSLRILDMTDIINLWCDCPRDDQFVRWSQSLNNLVVRGDCQTTKDFMKIESYLGSEMSPCDGSNHLQGNLFLYLLLGIIMTVYLL